MSFNSFNYVFINYYIGSEQNWSHPRYHRAAEPEDKSAWCLWAEPGRGDSWWARLCRGWNEMSRIVKKDEIGGSLFSRELNDQYILMHRTQARVFLEARLKDLSKTEVQYESPAWRKARREYEATAYGFEDYQSGRTANPGMWHEAFEAALAVQEPSCGVYRESTDALAAKAEARERKLREEKKQLLANDEGGGQKATVDFTDCKNYWLQTTFEAAARKSAEKEDDRDY